MALIALILLVASCLGYGLMGLRVLGILALVPDQERYGWAWTAGYAFLGAILFPLALLGFVQFSVLLGVLLLGLPGLTLLDKPQWPKRPDRIESALLAALCAFVVILILVAMAPPSDADSLAYHFARPKQILDEGRLTFVPRAVDGAAPLLIQLTYLPALALGGEKAMTLWAMLCGILPIFAVGGVARRWLSRRWVLALVLTLLTTPGMLYGLGSGQVETRIIPFVFFAGLALHEGQRRSDLRFTLLAGLFAGSFAAAKYFGLFFVAAAGLLSLLRPKWLAAGLLFSLGALATGAPVYAWNWSITGDPVFPALFLPLGMADSPYWTKALATFFTQAYALAEKPAPTNLAWLLAYPFKATLDALSGWESVRTGLGPLWLMFLPFALSCLPSRLRSLPRHPLAWLIVLSFLFYVLWFFLGASQRIRHLIPVYPGVLLAICLAAERAKRFRPPVLAAWGLVLALQMAGFLLYARPALAYQLSNETRDEYVIRSVPNSSPSFWINKNLTRSEKVLFFERQMTYYVDVQKFYAAPGYQSQVTFVPSEPDDFYLRWRQMMSLDITHMLLITSPNDDERSFAQNRTAWAFQAVGCARLDTRLPVTLFLSRTLPGLGKYDGFANIYRLTPESCDIGRLRLANSAPAS